LAEMAWLTLTAGLVWWVNLRSDLRYERL